MKPLRLRNMPEEIRDELKRARKAKRWTQQELGKTVQLAQRHISAIEAGKIVPRYDTLLDIVRVLDLDLVLAPRELVPAVQALIRDYRNRAAPGQTAERALYAVEAEEGDHG